MGSEDPEPSSWWSNLGHRILDKFDYRKTFNHVKKVAVKHGWKIAGVVVAIEVVEHFVIPGVLVSIGYPQLALVGGLPIAEFTVYPLLFKALGGNLA